MKGNEQVYIFLLLLGTVGVFVYASITPNTWVIVTPAVFFIYWRIYKNNRNKKKKEAVEFERWAIENNPEYIAPLQMSTEEKQEQFKKYRRSRNLKLIIGLSVGVVIISIAFLSSVFDKPKPYVNPHYPNLTDQPPVYVSKSVIQQTNNTHNVVDDYKNDENAYINTIETYAKSQKMLEVFTKTYGVGKKISDSQRANLIKDYKLFLACQKDVVKNSKKVTDYYFKYLQMPSSYFRDSLIGAIKLTCLLEEGAFRKKDTPEKTAELNDISQRMLLSYWNFISNNLGVFQKAAPRLAIVLKAQLDLIKKSAN